MIPKVDEHHSPANENPTVKRSCLPLFIFLLFIILTLASVTSVVFIRFTQLKKDYEIKEKIIDREHAANNRLIKQLTDTNEELNERILKLLDEQRQQNQTIKKLIHQCHRSRSSSKMKSIASTITTTTGREIILEFNPLNLILV